MEQKNWKVIKIIDDYRIVINGGRNDLLKYGDKLEIYAKGDPIKDPDTGEILGNLDLIKGRVSIKDIFEKFAVCQSRTETSHSAVSAIAGTLYKTSTLPLNVNPNEITGYNTNADNTINVGDLVRKSL